MEGDAVGSERYIPLRELSLLSRVDAFCHGWLATRGTRGTSGRMAPTLGADALAAAR